MSRQLGEHGCNKRFDVLRDAKSLSPTAHFPIGLEPLRRRPEEANPPQAIMEQQQQEPRPGDLSWRLSSHPITLLCFLTFRLCMYTPKRELPPPTQSHSGD